MPVCLPFPFHADALAPRVRPRSPWTPDILYISRPYASRARATPVCVVFAPPRPFSRAAPPEPLQCFPRCLAALTGCAEREPPCFSQRRRGAHHGTIHLSRERPASFHAPREAGVALALRERTAGRRGSSPKGSHEPSPRATDDAPSAQDVPRAFERRALYAPPHVAPLREAPVACALPNDST